MISNSQHSASAAAAFTAVRRHSRKLQGRLAGTASIAALTLIPHPGSTAAVRLADVAVRAASGPQFSGGFATDDDDDQAQLQEQLAQQQMQQAEQDMRQAQLDEQQANNP